MLKEQTLHGKIGSEGVEFQSLDEVKGVEREE